MKNLLIVCDVIGVVFSVLGVIVCGIAKNLGAALWAFSSAVWAVNALIKDIAND